MDFCTMVLTSLPPSHSKPKINQSLMRAFSQYFSQESPFSRVLTAFTAALKMMTVDKLTPWF
jgi:hypothetical protein